METLREKMAPADAALLAHLERLGFDVSRIKVVLPFFGRGKSKRGSRHVVFSDDTRMNVLDLLAWLKDPSYLRDTHDAQWADANPSLEVIENVIITKKAERKRKPSLCVAKSGTPAYYKEYREKNKDKIRASQKRIYERNKAMVQALREATKEKDPSVSSAKLDDILKS